MTQNDDPRPRLERGAMSALQIGAVATCIALNGLDGFDILSVSFASPGIANDWHVNREILGRVLSMELWGMAVGSILLGMLADIIGRRPVILGCVIIMALGMFMASAAQGVVDLSLWRLFTGLGIGGMLAVINAVVAEYTNARWRNLCLSLMVIGYPIGSVIGGMVSAQLLHTHDWRVVFQLGAVAAVLLLPLVWFFVPETPSWLVQHPSRRSLRVINTTLARMRHSPITDLPERSAAEKSGAFGDLFRGGMVATTLLVTLAYFGHITSHFFILKWAPKIVADMGFSPSLAAGVLVWAQTGGAIGGAIFGLLALKIPLKPLTMITFLGAWIMLTLFGRPHDDLNQLAWSAAGAVFFTNAGIVGLYTFLARVFPTPVRATGTGFVIGVGRAAAALAPILTGWLFQHGQTLPVVAAIMGSGSLIATLAIWRLKVQPGATV